jgi:hypothetical protein
MLINTVFIQAENSKPGVVVQTKVPATGEAEAGGCRLGPVQDPESLSDKQTKNKKDWGSASVASVKP